MAEGLPILFQVSDGYYKPGRISKVEEGGEVYVDLDEGEHICLNDFDPR